MESALNILLVEDDDICVFLTKGILQRMEGIKDIRTAGNGREAIDLLNEFYSQAGFLPDVILLDINMPVMNGFDFLFAFGKLEIAHKNNIKIIVLSSSVHNLDVTRAKALGASDYLSKPLSAENFINALA